MKVSVIIPVLNEETILADLISSLLKEKALFEIIVVDGGSTDATKQIANSFPDVIFHETQKGRSRQLHEGSELAKGDVFYFLHADARPAEGFVNDIITAIQNGHPCGTFIGNYVSDNYWLKLNSFFTHLPFSWCRGGDQSLFVTRNLYKLIGGFDPDIPFMEEYIFMQNLRKEGYSVHVIREYIYISDRKFRGRSWLKVNMANYRAMKRFRSGMDLSEVKVLYYEELSRA